MSKQDWQKVVVIAIAVCCISLILNPISCEPEPPVETDPVNPLTAELVRAYAIIDSVVSFNNLLIKELEECNEN